MNYKEAVEYLYSLQFFGIKMGLENILRLCRELGNPQEYFDCIHVAGTNGKGTASALIESVLRTAGYKTGLYTSPHLIDFSERIRVNGKRISEDFVLSFTEKMKPLISELKATFFEATTAMAFAYFKEMKVEIAVIETGMGGRLDATNIVNPVLTVITPISMDHTQYLGGTIEKISLEKAGILKNRIPVVVSDMEISAKKIFIREAEKKQCPVIYSEKFCAVENIRQTKTGYRFSAFVKCREYKLEIPFAGIHQIKNATNALCALFNLNGYNFADNDLNFGFSNAKWPARFQILDTEPVLVIDVSHNVQGAETLVQTLKAYFPYKPPVFVLGMMKDKDYSGFLSVISSLKGRIILAKPNVERAADVNDLEKAIKSKKVIKADTVALAVDKAMTIATDDEVVVVTGSFYTASEALIHLDIRPFE